MHTVGNQLKIHCGCHANQDLFQSMLAGYSLMTTEHTTGPKENYEKHTMTGEGMVLEEVFLFLPSSSPPLIWLVFFSSHFSL